MQTLDLALRVRSQMQQAIRDLDRLEGELRDVDRQAERTSSGVGKVGGALRTSFGPLLAGAGVALGLRAITRNTIEAEQALVQLDARLRSTGGAAGLNRAQLVEMASALQDVTTFGDETVQSVQALLLALPRIGSDVFERALAAVLDMSVGLKQDLTSAAVQVGKALNDPIRGVTALQRVGVQLNDQQREQIRVLVESGRVAEAQGLILSELETRYGGAARAARDTLGGALAALRNAFGDLLEGDASGGGIVDTKSAIEDLVRLLQDPGTKAAFQGFVGLLAGLGSGVVGLAAEVGDIGIAISEQVRIITGDLTELERIDSILREIGQRRRGPLVGGVGLLFKSPAELDAMEAELKTQRAIIVARQQAEAVGPPLPPPPIVNAEYEKLLASLREQAETMGLVGEAARVRYAIEQGALGELDAAQRANLLRYAEQIDAQERGTEAAKQAAQAAKQAAAEQARAAEQQRSYVADLERQVDLLGLGADQVRAYEIAERGLTGALRARAEAAAATLAADEQRRQAEADAQELAGLRIEQLRAEGRAEEALAAEIEQRYGELIERLKARGDAAGLQIIDNLINTERARTRLEAIQKQVEAIFGEQARAEQSVQAQQQAGLLSEMSARERILEIHQATQQRLEQLRPVLSELAQIPGQIGESAARALTALDAQAERLRTTTTLLGETLRDGLETGLTSALQGLARGTLNLRDAIDELVLSVSDALLQMSAQAIAETAVAGISGLFGGGAQSAGQAAAITAAGTAAASTMAAGVTTGGAAASAQMSSAIITAGAIAAQQMAAAAAAAGAANSISLGLAGGGQVLGPGTATSDSIRAWLSNQEFVTRAAVVTQPGALDFLHDFNARGMAALHDWSAIHHATGGLAGVPAPAFPAPSAEVSLAEPAGARVDNNFRFVNVFDVEDVSRRVTATGTFEKQVLNIVSSNPSAIRQRLGL